MLTGLPPYQGRGPKEILDQILAGPPKPITSQQAGADRGLVAVAEKAMARELRNRYADMRDVLKDLQLIKGGKAPLAQSRAHPMAPTAKLALALAAMALLALLTWFFWPRNLHQTAPLPAVVSSPSSPLPTSPQPVVTPAPVSPKPIVPEQRETTPHSQPPVAPSPLVPQPISPPPAPMPQPTPEPALTVALWATGNSCLGQPGVGGDADGVGDQVRFRLPNSVAVDRGGNVYVADTGNSVIRKIATDGTVTTLAGAGGITGSADGFGNRARFRAPFGIAVDTVGNVYVADTINNTIRKITTDGYVHTVAGLAGNPGSSFGLGSGARFRNPWGLAADEEGNVWVADTGNDVIRKITPAGQVITVAGEAGMSGHADGFGPLARFHAPFAVVADQRGHIYVADTGNHTIRRIAQGGEVVTVAGLPGQAGYADGSGSAARFSSPQGLAVDDSGNLYVADAGNNLIRKVSPAGWVTTLPAFANPSVSTGSTSSSLRLQAPGGVAVSARGILYVADTAQDCILKQFIPTP
jgi:sugar lactone lactonase YvrE